MPESHETFVSPDGCDYGQYTLGSARERCDGNLHLTFHKFDRSEGHGGEGAGDGTARDESGERERFGLREDGGLEGFLGETVLLLVSVQI